MSHDRPVDKIETNNTFYHPLRDPQQKCVASKQRASFSYWLTHLWLRHYFIFHLVWVDIPSAKQAYRFVVQLPAFLRSLFCCFLPYSDRVYKHFPVQNAGSDSGVGLGYMQALTMLCAEGIPYFYAFNQL